MITLFSIHAVKKPIANRFYASIKPIGFNSHVLLVAFLWFSFVTIANSQETDKVLSFSEVINKTLSNNPELKSFTHQYAASEGKIKQSTLPTRKELNLNVEDFAGSNELAGISGMQTTLSVSWVMENELLSSRYNLAKSSQGMIASNEKIKRLALANETAKLFINALALQEQVNVINDAIKLSESAVNEINKRVSAGKTFQADLLRAEAELAQQKLIAEDLNHEIQIAYKSLAAQWGEQSLNEAVLTGSLEINNKPISYESLKHQLNKNPRITQLATIERINEAKIDLAIAENKPRWKFMTGLRRNERTDDMSLVAGFTRPIGVKNRSSAKVAELKANMSQQISQYESLKITLQTSLYGFYQLMMHNSHLAEKLSGEIIPKLKAAQVKTKEAYLIGRYGYLDLKNVQDDLIDAQLTLLEARLNFHLNKIEIEAITGSQLFSNSEGK